MSSPKPSIEALRIERPAKSDSPGWGRSAIIVLLILLVGGAIAWWMLRPKPLAVHVAAARETANHGLDRTVLNASGYVTARREATVSSKITGKVMEVLVEEGTKVHENEVLARLDDTNVKASLLLAQAQLESAKASLQETRVRMKEADQEFGRLKLLLTEKIATQSDYDHAEASLLALKAKLEQQQADVTVADRNVGTWQQQLDDTVIRAPFSAIVTSKNAQPGEMISPMSSGGFTRTGICTIVDMESLEIEIDVNESYINRVTAGQPVEATLDAYQDWKIPCHVTAIIPTADRQKSTVKVRVGFDKLDPKILPEMSVKVAFHETTTASTSSTRAVIVPKNAVQQQDGKSVVFVVQNSRAERRVVSVSNSTADETTIAGGLQSGEQVALDWPPSLEDGSIVTVLAPEK